MLDHSCYGDPITPGLRSHRGHDPKLLLFSKTTYKSQQKLQNIIVVHRCALGRTTLTVVYYTGS